MPELSGLTEKLIQKYQDWQTSLTQKEGAQVLSVDEVASRLAFFYEKIKSIVDWHEEHLIRKVAIERDLKRRMVFQKENKSLAESLILELIRAGYFENGKIEEIRVSEVQKALDKYSYIIKNSPEHPKKKELSRWLLGLAACEIEEILDPPTKQKALLDYMFESMIQKIQLSPEAIEKYRLTEEEKNILIYIACQKSLFKLDDTLIAYHLLRLQYPDWDDLSGSRLEYLASNIYLIWGNIKKEFRHPAAKKIYAICEKYDAAYLILGDIISEEPEKSEELLKNPDLFEKAIGAAYDKREKIIKARVKRAAIYATLSIFISKILIVLALEIPFDRYVAGRFSYFSLIINILIPPLLMFLLIISIRPPDQENRQRLIMETIKIAYHHDKQDYYPVKAPRKRGIITNIFIYLVYLLTFLLSFGVIIWFLGKIHFSYFSQVVFIFFVCLIAFTGVKIRDRARELEIIEKRERVLSFVIDLLSLPIVKIGRWLAKQLSKYNAIIIFLAIIIDTPFQVFVEFLEKWRAFLKEKKAEDV